MERESCATGICSSSGPTSLQPPRLASPTSEAPLRPPLERNLAVCDFPQTDLIPTTEEVLAELQKVTDQYTNVDDPRESAARKQRVLQGENEGLMAATAVGIIAAATSNLSRGAEDIPTPPSVFNRLEFPEEKSPPPASATTK